MFDAGDHHLLNTHNSLSVIHLSLKLLANWPSFASFYLHKRPSNLLTPMQTQSKTIPINTKPKKRKKVKLKKGWKVHHFTSYSFSIHSSNINTHPYTLIFTHFTYTSLVTYIVLQKTNKMYPSFPLFLLHITMASAVHLRSGYYAETCPKAEFIVRYVMKKALIREPRSVASVMRFQFHDCFVNVSIYMQLYISQKNKNIQILLSFFWTFNFLLMKVFYFVFYC